MSARRFSVRYIDSLLCPVDVSAQAELVGIITSWSGYNRGLTFCGLPLALLVYTETVCWEAQSWRSGAWTYYEATPKRIQAEVWDALRQLAPKGFGEIYERGMRDWRSASRCNEIDAWLMQNETALRDWLKKLAETHRPEILDVS